MSGLRLNYVNDVRLSAIIHKLSTVGLVAHIKVKQIQIHRFIPTAIRSDTPPGAVSLTGLYVLHFSCGYILANLHRTLKKTGYFIFFCIIPNRYENSWQVQSSLFAVSLAI